jgi:DNA polymerase III subunit epsilon
MTMYLVFDTETTGLPTSYDAPASDVENWPRVVQLAWEAFDFRGRRTGRRCFVIRPDGFKIPRKAERIHGISTDRAKRTGIPIAEALDEFDEALLTASVLVAHNFSFDSSVLGAEFHRLGVRPDFRRKIRVCTMKDTTEYCALPGRYGSRWPKLPELHRRLFRKNVRETHDAAADVAICSKCFFGLKRLGLIRIKGGAHR